MEADIDYIVRQALSPGAKVLWLVLRKGGAKEYSQPWLSRYTNRSLPAIADDLSQLKVNGLLEVKPQGAGKMNHYRATIRKGNA